MMRTSAIAQKPFSPEKRRLLHVSKDFFFFTYVVYVMYGSEISVASVLNAGLHVFLLTFYIVLWYGTRRID